MTRETPRAKMEMRSDTEEEEEDRRRETALATTPLLQAGFKSSKVSQSQLDKIRELHQRRLQVKGISKDVRKAKDNTNGRGREPKKEADDKECKEKDVLAFPEDAGFPISKEISHLSPDEDANSMMPKKRQKLYWGLDTKERWERKSNM